MMKLLMALIVCTAVIGNVRSAGAQDQAVKLEHHGMKGMWLPMGMARLALADGKELQLVKPQLADLRLQLSIRDQRIIQLKEALNACEAGEARAIGALDSAVELQLAAEDKMNAWYRHPAMWTGVGVLMTLLLQVGALALFKQLD